MNLEPLEVHADPRGRLVEAFKLPQDGLVFYISINPKETRGNHYHLRKVEHFLVIAGSALFQARNRETGDLMKAEVNGFRPMKISVYPNTTHSITATSEGCLCLVWCSEQLDPNDTDTYPEEI